MQPHFGYWDWDEASATLHRSDGARVGFRGPADDISDTGTRRWLRFDLHCDEGDTPLLVEQRLTGFDSQYRYKSFRIDLTRSSLAGGTPPRSFRQWAAWERIAADALACWPAHFFAGAAHWIGIEGVWSDGAFRAGRYRLYRGLMAKRPLKGGSIPPASTEQHWSYFPLDPTVPLPDLGAAKQRSSRTLRDALAQLAGRGPALVSEERAIVLLPKDESGRQPLLYVDPEYVSDRFNVSRAFRGTSDSHWEINSLADVVVGTRELDSLQLADEDLHSPPTVMSVLQQIFPPHKRSRRSVRSQIEEFAIDHELEARLGDSFAEAFFSLPQGIDVGKNVASPPTMVTVKVGWKQAGYLSADYFSARELTHDDLHAVFADPLPPRLTLSAANGVRFEPDRAILVGPDGARLAFDGAIEQDQGLGPRQFVLRCMAAGLNWPVVVRRNIVEQSRLFSWTVDHDASRAIHASENSRPPNPDDWEILRQFLEDALLSWGDNPLSGPAPQQVQILAGFYDGEWRDSDFSRNIERPYPMHKPSASNGNCSYHAPVLWLRSDALAVGAPAVPNGYGRPVRVPPVAFVKEAPGARYWASAFAERQSGPETYRFELADYQDEQDHVRIVASRTGANLCTIIRLNTPVGPSDPRVPFRWRGQDDGEIPSLDLWRRMRDAAEGGLRPGEAVTVTGVWIFGQFYPWTKRTTSWVSDRIELPPKT